MHWSGLRYLGFQFHVPFDCHPPPGSGLYIARSERMEKKVETTLAGFVGTTIRIHSFIPNQRPEVQVPFQFLSTHEICANPKPQTLNPSQILRRRTQTTGHRTTGGGYVHKHFAKSMESVYAL